MWKTSDAHTSCYLFHKMVWKGGGHEKVKDETKKRRANHAAYMREWRRKQKEKKAAASVCLRSAAEYEPDLDGFFAWAEAKLKVPSGPLQGEPFLIDDWQQHFLREAHTARESGLSVARKNGKSGLIAAYVLGHLVGPLNRPDWRGVVISLTGELAKELRLAISLTAEASGFEIIDRQTPQPGRVEGDRGAAVKFLASDRATGHAIGSDLAIIDEAGLLEETHRELWNAVLSSTSGRNGRLLCISIQGMGPMFKEMRDRAQRGVCWHEYAAPLTAAIDQPQTWHAANPGLRRGIKSMEYMRDMAQRALDSPADQPSFRAYDLNQPQDPSRESLCSLTDWMACVHKEPAPRRGPCVIGFDLGGASSMTALCAFWPATGRAEAWGAFPSTPNLIDRGARDGVGGLYQRMADRGELKVYPGRVTPVGEFLLDCADQLKNQEVSAAGCDRYRAAEAAQALQQAAISWPMVYRGQGASAGADGSHDVRAFQRYVLRADWSMAESLLFESAVRESSIRRDPAGNPALERSRSRGRIDVLQAGVIAAGLGELLLGTIGLPRARVVLA